MNKMDPQDKKVLRIANEKREILRTAGKKTDTDISYGAPNGSIINLIEDKTNGKLEKGRPGIWFTDVMNGKKSYADRKAVVKSHERFTQWQHVSRQPSG